jgi:hypothetical protein
VINLVNVGILSFLLYHENLKPGFWNISIISIIIIIGGLAIYLNKKIFPNYRLFYGLKIDKNGDYLLE